MTAVDNSTKTSILATRRTYILNLEKKAEIQKIRLGTEVFPKLATGVQVDIVGEGGGRGDNNKK